MSKIDKPGRYDLPMAVYRGQCTEGLSVSSSDAQIVAGMEPLTPAHVRAEWAKVKERARKAEFGTAVHCLVLEPFRSSKQVVVIDDTEFRKDATKKAADDALAAGLTPLLAPDYERAQRVAEILLNHRQVSKWLAAGAAEQSCFARDEENGIWLKARPDFFTGDRVILDFKTVGSTSDKFIRNRITESGWFMQAPWYCDVVNRIDREPPQDFRWVCIEQEEPHAIRIIQPPDSTLAAGGNENAKARAIFGECARTGQWPAYSGQVEQLGLADWAHYRLEDEALNRAPGMEAARMAVETGANPFG